MIFFLIFEKIEKTYILAKPGILEYGYITFTLSYFFRYLRDGWLVPSPGYHILERVNMHLGTYFLVYYQNLKSYLLKSHNKMAVTLMQIPEKSRNF